MKEITYNFIDKSKWPERGPWDNEPDKVQWLDAETGYPCLAVRAVSHWCGYVGVNKNHPDFNKDYNNIDVSVHGGLTFTGYCQKNKEGICHLVEEGEDDNIYWLGFDCAHSGDLRPPTTQIEQDIYKQFPILNECDVYRTLEYVKSEVKELAKQLKERECLT